MSPFFSVIIPTRNRAVLLRRALKSVLWQTFPDYEVIVYDNASRDNTLDVVKGFDDARIRYIYSRTRIQVQASFEEAFKVAKGHFLHIMGDDDALLPHCLERAKEVIEKHNARLLCVPLKALYYYPDWVEETLRNTLLLRTFTGEDQIMDSKMELKRLFEVGGFSYKRHPCVTNAFILKKDIDYLMNKYGQVLLNDHCGDISVAVFLLDLTDRYILLDEPLHIAGFSVRSNSANVSIMDRTLDLESLSEEFKAWFSDEQKINRLLQGVPFKIPIRYNFDTATLLQQKAMLGLPFKFNWELYFHRMWGVMADFNSRGKDTSSAEGEFLRALSQQSLWVRVKLALYLLTRKRRILARGYSLMGAIVKYLSIRGVTKKNVPSSVTITGGDGGFSDILGASGYYYQSIICNKPAVRGREV